MRDNVTAIESRDSDLWTV